MREGASGYHLDKRFTMNPGLLDTNQANWRSPSSSSRSTTSRLDFRRPSAFLSDRGANADSSGVACFSKPSVGLFINERRNEITSELSERRLIPNGQNWLCLRVGNSSSSQYFANYCIVNITIKRFLSQPSIFIEEGIAMADPFVFGALNKR